MAQIPISAEARGRLRVWKSKAADKFAPHQEDVRDAAVQFLRRGSRVGRTRAFEKVRRLLPARAVLEGVRLEGDPLAVWAMLRARGPVAIDPDTRNGRPVEPYLKQDCVVVEYILVGKVGVSVGLWTLEVPDHALGRMLDRMPGADIDAVLLAAHHAALRAQLDDEKIRTSLANNKSSFLLPAGDGVFSCEIRAAPDVASGGALHVHLFAHTWLHLDQLHDDQTPLLVDGAEGARLGDGVLLPAAMHRLDRVDDSGRVQIRIWAPGLPETLARPIHPSRPRDRQ